MKQKTSQSHKVSEAQRLKALAEFAAGGRAVEIARRYGVSATALYQWRQRRPNGKALVAATAEPIVVAQRDALIFLRKGKQELLRGIRSGTVHDFDNMHLMALLALNSLQEHT